MADVEDMFVENDDYELDLSSTDSELEELELLNAQLTDTVDQSDISRDTLSNFSVSDISDQIFEDYDENEFPFYSNNVINEGRRLYLIFLQNEVLKNRLILPEYLIRASKIIDCKLCKNVYSFHKLLTRFELSAQRKWVREQAREIVFQGLSFRHFTEKLKKLFQEARISWEKVLVIFSFCADVSIRALNCNSERQFEKIQDWTLVFLDGYICAWVQAEGGWDVILHRSYTPAAKIAIISFCCVGIIALIVYIRNNSKQS